MIRRFAPCKNILYIYIYGILDATILQTAADVLLLSSLLLLLNIQNGYDLFIITINLPLCQ